MCRVDIIMIDSFLKKSLVELQTTTRAAHRRIAVDVTFSPPAVYAARKR
jgi:hypothetical protein